MTKFRERMQATGASMRMLAEVAGVSSSLVCYIAQGYARFPTYEQLCRVCDFMHCKPTDLCTKDELRRWYKDVPIEPRRPSKEGSPRVRIDKSDYDYLRSMFLSETNDTIRWMIHEIVDAEIKYLEDALLSIANGGAHDTTGT